MLSENIKNRRLSKGLSQQELAVKINVVRQTVSKWETGLSVPDAEMLVDLAETLDTTVGQLLGETAVPEPPDKLETIAAKLEILNDQFAARKEGRRRAQHSFFIGLGIAAGILLALWLAAALTRLQMTQGTAAGAGVIGGADGATQIFVAAPSSGIIWLIFGVICAVAAAVGIYKTKR